MFRVLTAMLLALAATACSYGSDIDLAPKQDRMSKRVVSTGDYCEASGHKPYTIRSSEECVRLIWDQGARSYTMIEAGGETSGPFAPVSLHDNVFLIQAESDEIGGRYRTVLGLASGSAFFLLPVLQDEEFLAVAQRHPAIEVKSGDGDPVITGGGREQIRAFLKSVAIEAARKVDLNSPDLTVAIGDTAGAADHPANALQSGRISEVFTALRKLQASN